MVILVIKVQYIYAHIFFIWYGSDSRGIITMLKDRKYIDVKKTKCMRLIKEKY